MAKRVALVYDWADTRWGGAEKVLTALGRLYPDATLFTAFVEPEATWTRQFKRVRTTFLQRLPRWLRQRKHLLAPLFPIAFEQFNFDRYDLIISVSSFAAKGILTKDHQLHVCYLLTPTRFLYSHAGEYLPSRNILVRRAQAYLRRWDQVAIWRPDRVIAISRLVANRCQEYYGREADDIIYPSLQEISRQKVNKSEINDELPEKFFLCVGRLAPYKHLLTVAEICARQGYPLVIIGDGQQRAALDRLVREHPSNLTWLPNTPQNRLKVYYNKALALVAPGLEDFGINLLEANAAGTLVVTHPDSGARELLEPAAARDLDAEDVIGSLERCLSELASLPKQSAPRQRLGPEDFATQWRQRIESYEKN